MSLPSCAIYENTLGGTRPRRHIAPQIRAAGITGNQECGTVAELTSNYYSSGRVTPDLIRSYRRGGEVGRTYRHYGYARDPLPDESVRHGIKSSAAEGARECLQPTRNALSSVMEDQLERMYLSSLRRPLGCGPTPPYDVPVPCGGFGVCTDRSESVKRVLYSGKDVDILHPVGERKDRGYDWERARIDPTQHRFGKTHDGCAATSAADVMRYNRPGTTLLPKLVQDFQVTAKAGIGRPLCYGFDNTKFEELAEKKAVLRSRRGDGDAAREVLSSWAVHPATLKAQEDLLARTTASGAKPFGDTAITAGARSAGDYGVFGDTVDSERSMPLSRFSRTLGEKKRGAAALLTELDDEARAIHLLFPSHYVQLGVQSRYFAGGRNLDDIRRLCKKIDFGLNDRQIDEVFALIAVDGKCGIEQFKNKAVEMGYLP